MRLFGLRISPAVLSFGVVILAALILWPELYSDLARTSDVMPHGFGFQWESDILTLHVVSDMVIWLSYMGLSGLLATLVWRFRAMPGRLPLWAGMASGGFIFFCGLTHLMGIVVIWQPLYWLDGGMKALTALASFATLIGGIKFRGQIIQVLNAAAQRDQLLATQQQAVTQLQTALATHETDLTTLTEEITRQRGVRIQIVQALRESEERFRRIFAVNPSPKLITRADNRQIVSANPAFALLSGYTQAELIGNTTDALGLWAETSLIAQTRAQLQQDGQLIDRELPFRTRDGSIRDLLVSTVPVELDGVACFLTVMLDQTEHKRAAAVIAEVEARYRSLFENMRDGYAYCQILLEDGKPSDYLFIDVNSAFTERTGLPPVIGKKISEVVPGIHESDPMVLEIYGRVALTGTPAHFETYLKAMGFWFSIAVYSPKQGYFVAIFDNITTHKQAELALAQSHDRLLRAEQIGQLGSWEWRRARDQVLCSDGLYQVFGLAPQEFGMTHAAFLARIHSEDRAYVEHMLNSAFRVGGIFEFENRIIRPDDQVRILHTRGELLHDGDAAARLTGMTLDITERKQAEAMQRVSDQRFQSIFDLSPDLICIASIDGYFRLVNPAFSRVLDYAPEELLNARFLNFIHPDDHAAVEAVIADKLSQGETVLSFQCRYIRKNGESVWLEWISQPFESLIFAIGRDITERKRVEELLARQAEDLRRSNTDLEQFAYVASHDLQEPLRMVTSYVQLLQRRYQGELDTKADMYIAYAVDGAARMQTLIEDLLAYARVGRANVERTPTDCTRVLEQVQALLAATIIDAGATITVGPLPIVLADAGQIAQLFQNLISNAIKFHGAEPPRIQIAATRQGAEWRFAVRDNGIGIEPQYIERIFVIFQRLHTRAEYPGTGIGLAICKKIVEHHGGRIWLESQPGAGTTFFFTFPILEKGPHERLHDSTN